jgi:serine/threonine-protein kinase
MGRVVLARDPVLERQVAIKMLRDDLGLPPEHRKQLFERMRQEARASARVSHPNIVALFDMGEDPEYGLYLVFEYVKGATLKDHIGTRSLDFAAISVLSRELGSALTTAHDAGVLHRDIKPENVILSPTGGKIADFGIARLPESTLTRDGRLLGTPAYSSPESISKGAFSPASDQFSLAATLYEAISEQRAFPGDDAVAVATRITTEQPPQIASALGLDPAVDDALLRAMAKDPAARFPSCEQFGRTLADALTTCDGKHLRRGRQLEQQRLIASRDREIGGKTLRVVAGAATLGALVMAFILHATRSCQGPSIVPGSDASYPPPTETSTTQAVRPRTPSKSARAQQSGRTESVSSAPNPTNSTKTTASETGNGIAPAR